MNQSIIQGAADFFAPTIDGIAAIRDRIWPWCKFRRLEAEVKYQRKRATTAISDRSRARKSMHELYGAIGRALRND